MPMECLVSSMNRLSLFALLSVAGIGLQAQTTLSTMTISTSPSGARFSVDGTVYNQAATFTWPAGSEHLVVFITDPALPGQPANTSVQTAPQGDTQYIFQAWVDNLALTQPKQDPVQTVTADPSITSLTATVQIGYRIQLNFFGSPGPLLPPTCGAPAWNRLHHQPVLLGERECLRSSRHKCCAERLPLSWLCLHRLDFEPLLAQCLFDQLCCKRPHHTGASLFARQAGYVPDFTLAAKCEHRPYHGSDAPGSVYLRGSSTCRPIERISTTLLR